MDNAMPPPSWLPPISIKNYTPIIILAIFEKAHPPL